MTVMKKKDEHDFEHLLNWVEGRLSAAEAKELEGQLDMTDDSTRTLIEWLQEFQRLSQSYVLVSPPESLDEPLYNIFTRHSKTEPHAGFFQQMMATLTFDSYQHLTAAGVRTPAASKLERQFVYSTDLAEIAIDLQWDAQEKRVHVNGQLFPLDGADETIYVVELQSNSKTVKMAPTDDLGKFAFPSLVPDTYDIIVSGEQNEIAITGVELRF